MDSAKYVTQHKRIYIDIGKKIKSKMCYKIKCAILYIVDLINNNINRDVQEECANWLYRVSTQQQYGWWRIVNVLQFIKLSPVNVIRPNLSLSAWWPGGRSSSQVSQFLPSCSGSACQVAVKWKDGYQGDWVFDYFSSSAFAAFEVDVLQRGESRPRDVLS